MGKEKKGSRIKLNYRSFIHNIFSSEKDICSNMEKRNELIDSLLKFYTSKSISFASFLVGCIFGLFTVLSLLDRAIRFSTAFLILTALYWILFCFGGYCVLKYGYYAFLGEKTVREIDQMVKDPLYQPSLPRENFWRWFSSFSHPMRSGLTKVFGLGVIYLGIGFGAYFAVL